MKKETVGTKAKRSALEAVLWAGTLVLGLALVGAFVFVVVVLVSAPKATFVSDLKPPKKKPPVTKATTRESGSKPPVAAPSEKPLVPGLVARYYRFKEAITDLPKLEGRKEQLKRIEKKAVNYESTERGFAGTSFTDNFAVRWEGVIRIPKDGRYTFFTISDDGSWLTIGGKAVVKNPGLHSMEEQRGHIDLKKGDHPFRVDFFEGSGGAGCKVLWEAPGIPRAVVPAEAFFHRSKD